MRYPQAKIILFTRAPEPGKAKTRLVPSLGEQGAATLQQRMSRYIIDQLMQAQLADIEIQCQPDCKHSFFNHLLSDYCIELNNQQGADLGEKMAHAMQRALEQYPYVVIIGTDAPVLSPEYIDNALQQLQAGQDVVLGPAEDGGYVLIGCSTFNGHIFQDIDWGTEHVLQQTRQRIKESHANCHELALKWDVDRVEDLDRLSNDSTLSFLLDDLKVIPGDKR